MSVYKSIKRGLEQAIAYENGETTEARCMKMTMEKRIMDKRNWFQKLFGYCPCCGKWLRRIKTVRQATQYVDDTQNWFTGCKKCDRENDEYWADMWEQYYGSI